MSASYNLCESINSFAYYSFFTQQMMCEEKCAESSNSACEDSSMLNQDDGSRDRFQVVCSERIARLSSPEDLVDLARQINKADDMCRFSALNKLSVVADQIRHLQGKAREILQRANRDNYLNHVQCNFVKQPGQFYHLYKKRDCGTPLFSRISPVEWGPLCPYDYVDSYKLEMDLSWVSITEKESNQNEENLRVVKKLIDSPGFTNFITND